jgi:hypothetical protein
VSDHVSLYKCEGDLVLEVVDGQRSQYEYVSSYEFFDSSSFDLDELSTWTQYSLNYAA